MSHRILSDKLRIARKEYECQSYRFINLSFGLRHLGEDIGMYLTDYRTIANAKKEGGKIKKGTQYMLQTFVYGGEIHTYRSRFDIFDLREEYDIWDDWWD